MTSLRSGALHGETALPPDLLAEVEGRGTILELADDLVLELLHGPELHGTEVWAERYPAATAAAAATA